MTIVVIYYILRRAGINNDWQMKTSRNDCEPAYLGNSVRRIREIVGMKQFALAEACGWSQQQMSRIENSESISDEHLETISKALGVTPEFIKNFKEERAVYNVVNNYDGTTFHEESIAGQFQPVFNLNSAENLSELIEKFIRDELQKSQSLAELGKVVLELVDEVKKLQAANKRE